MAAIDKMQPLAALNTIGGAALWEAFKRQASQVAWDWYYDQPAGERLVAIRTTLPVPVPIPLIRRKWTVNVPLRVTVTSADAARAIAAVFGGDPRARAAAEQTVSTIEVVIDEEAA
jgi:hypothetical protein